MAKKQKKSFSRLRDVIRDFVFGMEDGLVSNLGLVLGVYVGGAGQFAVILAGLASMFVGAFSMSAGSYLSAKSQREVYEQEIAEATKGLEKNPRRCLEEMKKILESEGLGKKEIAFLFRKSAKFQHPKFVCNYMVQRKVGISKEKLDLPFKNALTMFLSFLFGSSFPIAPFVFLSPPLAPYLAAILTVVVLFLVGWAKTIYTKLNWFKSGIEIVLIGVGAGILGYLVGFILKGGP